MPCREMENSETCPVCHEAVDSYAIGDCDHPICYRCSIRMRALCEQMYCPICRNDLTKVYIVKSIKKFNEIPRHGYIPNRKYKMFFENGGVLSKFEKLLEHRCSKCKNRPPDKNFKALQDHLRKDHSLYYCDLCVEHLKIFTHERKFYNRHDLATHRRVGDKNDSSYKGHPLCHFCDERYLDSDELFRHLRKDHYYCHFCETAGSNEYYNDYTSLKDHFRAKHYLCEEGDCGHPQTQFTHAFPSLIDLKAHVTASHIRNKNKAEARQARTIDVDFQLPPRNRRKDRGVVFGDDYEEVSHSNRDDRSTRSGRGRGRGQGHNRTSNQRDRFRDDEIQQAIQASLSVMKEENNKKEEKSEDKELLVHSEDNFPTLAGGQILSAAVKPTRPDSPADSLNRDSDSETKGSSMAGRIAQANKMSVQHGALGLADFPTLNTTENLLQLAQSKTTKDNVKTNVQNVPRSVQNPTNTKSLQDDFPELPTSRKVNNNTGNKGAVAWGKKQKLEQPSQGKSQVLPIGGGTASKTATGNHSDDRSSTKMTNLKRPSRNVFNDDQEFPTLGGSGSVGAASNSLLWGKNAKEERKQKSVDWFDMENNPDYNMEKFKGDNEFSMEKFKGDKYQDVGDKSGSKKKNKKKSKDTQKSKEQSSVLNVKEQSLFLNGDNSSLDNIASTLLTVETTTKKSVALESDITTSNRPEVDGENNSFKDKNKNNISEEDFLLEKEDSPIPQHLISENIYDKLSEIPQASAFKSTLQSTNSKKSSGSLLKSEDFPALATSSKPPGPPPGFQSNKEVPDKKTPPGFNTVKPGSRPPPGFNVSPTINTSNDKENTSTLNLDIQQMIPMVTDNIGNFSYVQPDNFSSRNKKLISDISMCLEDDQDKFDNFKMWSHDFRADSMVASEYYDRCQSLLGVEKFDNILTELLVLLPDIYKQQELLTAHIKSQSRRRKQKGNVIKISDSSKKDPWSNVASVFQTCPTCQQVLGQADYTNHVSVHGKVDMDFPSLHSDTVPSGSVLKAWVKAN